MIVAQINSQLKENLDLYKIHGGSIDFVSLKLNDYPVEYDLHKIAAKTSMFEIDLRYTKMLSKFSGFGYNPSIMKGNKITFEEFLGSWYSKDNNRLIVEEFDSSGKSYTCIAGSPETKIELEKNSYARGLIDGYAEIFSKPPYGIKLKGMDLDTLFYNINNQLFGGLCDSLEIYEWGENKWCSYFEEDLGWGSYLWTVFNKDTKQICGIATNASD